MASSARPAMPAVSCVVAFVSGVCCADVARGAWAAWLAAGLALILGAPLSRRRPRLCFGLALAALVALGAARGAIAFERAQATLEAWLPTDGKPLETDVLAWIRRAPEIEADGSLTFLATLRAAPPARRPAIYSRLRVEVSDPRSMARVARLRRGDEIRVWCRLRAAAAAGGLSTEDAGRALLAQGLHATGSVKSARLVRKIREGRPGVARWLDNLRTRSLARLDRALGEQGRGRAIVGAMVLGERSRLHPDDVRRLREGGLLHVLAISGLHVSLVALAITGALRRILVPPWVLSVGASAAIGVFIFTVGAAPPAVRAGIGAMVALGGRAIGREGDALNTLALTAGLMVAFSPALVGNAGFQLTVLATAGLVALSGPIASALPLPRWLARALALSVAAYAATAPVLVWRFERLTPVALLSNLLAGPLSALVLGSGAATVLLDGAPVLGSAFAALAGSTAEVLVALASLAERCPFGSLRVARPPAALLLAYIALLLFVAPRFPGTARAGRTGLRLVRFGFVLATALLHVGAFPTGRRGSPEVAVLDVGQGLAVALRGPAGRCLLLDAGGTARGRFDAGERIVTPHLLRWGCRRLDALLLTHDHEDHAGGASAVLRDLEVGEVWIGVGGHRDPRIRSVSHEAVRAGAAVGLAERGFRRRLAGVNVQVLHPARDDASLPVNDRCLVLRLDWEASRLLVPGDIEAEGEARILARGEDVSAAVLVVAHHGAAGSTSTAWLSRVRPRVAIVSAGRGNRFGHPHPRVTERLERAGCAVLRTDRDGTVRLRPTDDGTWAVETEIRGKRSGGG